MKLERPRKQLFDLQSTLVVLGSLSAFTDSEQIARVYPSDLVIALSECWSRTGEVQAVFAAF